ncbi:hypothetical protein Nepgr_032652 [Nepenthes gracilis]|uniref:Agenet domain-containing protein n=1 Tax=Nepenthes gracilis TaxID=150966 RepID=A0AAD3Y818_NEPGR|nr:hypothetical protein Nepgr_032652 [Nepenthes gracilis]
MCDCLPYTHVAVPADSLLRLRHYLNSSHPRRTGMADDYEDLCKRGAVVEVSSDDEGLRGSWYTATVLRAFSRRSNKVFVEYHSLMVDDEGSKPLREFINAVLIRPIPPREEARKFLLSEEVDAYHNDGWWEGVVTKVLEGSRYAVFFRCSREQIEFAESELRLHREWVQGDWVPPLEQKPSGNRAVAQVESLYALQEYGRNLSVIGLICQRKMNGKERTKKK